MFGNKLGLKDDAKRAIADDFAIRVRDVASIARLSVRGNDLDYLSGIVDGYAVITLTTS